MYRAINIGGPEGDIKMDINKSLLEDLTTKVASRFTVIPEAFLNESVADTAGDGGHSYARVLCHFAAIVHLFTDACKEEMVNVPSDVGSCVCFTSLQRGRLSMHLRLLDYKSNLLLSSLTFCTS